MLAVSTMCGGVVLRTATFSSPDIRVLSCLAAGSRSQRYLGTLEIADEVIIPPEPTTANFLEQLYPESYCDDVIADFHELDGSLQSSLLGPHLVTVYHHKLIHRLSDPGDDLTQSMSYYHELAEVLNTNSDHNFASSISAFHHLGSNVVAALCQFSNHRTDAELCIQTAELIKAAALRLSATQYNEKPVVVRSTMLDRIDRAISVLVSAHHRLQPLRPLGAARHMEVDLRCACGG